MEQLLLKFYRRYVPKWIKRGLSDDMKDWLLGLLIYVASRPNLETLRIRRRAIAAMRRGDWRAAVDQWQWLAIQSKSIARGQAGKVPAPDEIQRKMNYARNQLRTARLHLARELHSEGKSREFRALTARIMEMIPDQRVLKKERDIIDLVRTYVQDALQEDGVAVRHSAVPGKPLRIALCLDVLKVSDVHTHSRVVFAMCRNLMAVSPDIETHIIVTNERFAVTTPVVATAFNPARSAIIYQMAREAFGEDYGTRFFMHVFHNTGLEGLINSSKSIIDIAPDVILYGGGHRGLFSNESRVIRHCLYDHFPTAFFYIQANNQVDDKLDMIIARGPHEIEGDAGEAMVRVQPYPTINEQNLMDDAPIDMDRQGRKVIVSAITGVRMNVQMEEQSDTNLKTMFSILDRVPGTVWYLIGAANPDDLVASNSLISRRVEAGQIKVYPVQPFETFTEMVNKASLFLHMPGFTGGSGGATVARRMGIPILTFRHSDVSGRQPQETIFAKGDVKGWAALACRLLTEQDVWLDTVKAQRAHTDWIRRTSGQGFYDCLAEASEKGQARIKAPAPRQTRKDGENIAQLNKR